MKWWLLCWVVLSLVSYDITCKSPCRSQVASGDTKSGSKEDTESGSKEGKASGSREDKESGSKEDKESGSKEDKESGSKEDKESGSKEKKESGSKEGKASGSKEDKESESKEDKESGSKEDKESGSKEDKESGSKEGKASGSREDKESGSKDKKESESKEEKESGSKEGKESGSKETKESESKEEKESESKEKKESESKEDKESESKEKKESGSKEDKESGSKEKKESESKEEKESGSKEEKESGSKEDKESGSKEKKESESKEEKESGSKEDKESESKEKKESESKEKKESGSKEDKESGSKEEKESESKEEKESESKKDKESGSKEDKESESKEKKESGSKEDKESGSKEEKESGSKEDKESGSKEKKESESKEEKESGSKEDKESESKEKKESGSKEKKESGSKEDKESGSKEEKESGSKEKKESESKEDKESGSKEEKESESKEEKESESKEDKESGSKEEKESESKEEKESESKKDKESGSKKDKESGSKKDKESGSNKDKERGRSHVQNQCKKKPQEGVASTCIEDVNNILKSGNYHDTLEAIESLAQFLEETEVNETTSMNSSSFLAILLKSKGPFTGLEIYASENEAMTDKTVTNSKVRVRLPRELDAGSDTTIVFSMLKLPETNETSDVLYERRLVGLSVRGKNISGLQEVVNITINLTTGINETQEPRCVFLDFSTKNYSNEGCGTSWERGQDQVTCSSDHLTYFGVLMVTADLSPIDLEVQSYITLIGCCLSLFALVITVLLFITNRKLREDVSMKVHLNLAIALILLNLHLLPSQAVAALSSTGLCLYMALSLHYSLLATFSWMALEGFHIYLLLVRVFNIYIRRYLLKLSVVGWGIPAVIVFLVVVIDRESYGRVPVTSNPNSTTMCYIGDDTVKMVTTVGVFSLVFIFNVVMLGVTVRRVLSLHHRKEIGQSDRTRAKRGLCTLLGVTTLLGITWGLIFFSFGQLSTAGLYVFAILNPLQGVFIFLWFVMSMRKIGNSASTKMSSETRSTNS